MHLEVCNNEYLTSRTVFLMEARWTRYRSVGSVEENTSVVSMVDSYLSLPTVGLKRFLVRRRAVDYLVILSVERRTLYECENDDTTGEP